MCNGDLAYHGRDKKATLNPDFGVTEVNVPLTGNVSTNDQQTPGSTYSNPPANPSNPSGCAPVVASNGTYSFTCSVPGEYSFMVPVCEPSPSTSCTSIPLTITVLDPTVKTNAPVANTDYARLLQDSSIVINVRSNDRCQNGPGCSLSTPSVVTSPSHGSYNPTTGVYTPSSGYVGVDSFRYAVCDNQSPVAKCDSEWVYITVLPTGSANTTNAMDDYGQTPNGAKLNGDVKANDTDPENNTQTVTAQTTTTAGKGTLVLNTDGTYTFTPDPSFVGGPVDFAYTTCDNGTPQACATATLHIMVETRKATLNPDFGVTEVNVPLTGNVSTNDQQTPGSTYSNPPANASNPSGCAPVVASNGTYSFTCSVPGEYSFMVPVCEPSPSTSCTSIPLTITVLDPTVKTNAPVANTDYARLLQDSSIVINVRSNDRCQNGPGCSLSTPSVVTSPSHGSYNPTTGVYTPSSGYVGVDSFRYAVCDNQSPVAKCDSEWVYITVLPTEVLIQPMRWMIMVKHQMVRN
ncbi:MAG: cadherin-like domain-containing protein [Bacteroidetes bacterium]|nr:cadherin-like domain-containing protein [Bacteroidota bacterium]